MATMNYEKELQDFEDNSQGKYKFAENSDLQELNMQL